MKVNPDSVKIAAGDSRTFSATAQTPWGYSIRLLLKWSATGGTVNETGRYVAGKTPGRYVVVATASTGAADTAIVVVTGAAGNPTTRRVVLNPENVTLAKDETQRFTLAGQVSDGSTFEVDPQYTVTGGTISSRGTYTAGVTAGPFRVIAKDAASGLADTSNVTIEQGNGGGDPNPPTEPLRAAALRGLGLREPDVLHAAEGPDQAADGHRARW